MGEVVLVLGGSRSGKTGFSQDLAAAYEKERGLPVAYLATAELGDEEMRLRAERHRRNRPSSWTTREEPLAAAEAVRGLGTDHSAVILDCLTLFLSNHLLRLEALPPEAAAESILAEVGALLAAAEEVPAPLIVVSNEVGVGVVPPCELGRRFQDVAGLAHQKIAAKASAVYFMVAGLPMKLK